MRKSFISPPIEGSLLSMAHLENESHEVKEYAISYALCAMAMFEPEIVLVKSLRFKPEEKIKEGVFWEYKRPEGGALFPCPSCSKESELCVAG